MKIFGLEITRKKKGLSSLDGRANGSWLTIMDTFPGAWQQNVEVNPVEVTTNHAVFSCITLIANDIGKLRIKLTELDKGVWTEVTSPAFSPVLRKPNRYQNAIQFRENWIHSKLFRGNAYILKGRDNRGVVTSMYVLDPDRVTPLVSDDGGVYYQLQDDNLAQIYGQIIVPASEIIHDRMNCLFHPLVGLSPIYAAGLAATQGVAMQKNSSRLFTNMSRPSGILVAPGPITATTAATLKENWDSSFTGSNFGKTAVIGDGMKYERLSITAEEAQFIDQLKWTGEIVCSCFHVPPFKVGLGQMPTYQNAELLNQVYYSDCLQSLIEQMEAVLDEGLGLDSMVNGRQMGIELDLEGLLRMDTATRVKTLTDAVNGSIMTTNEARQKIDLQPVDGGDTIWRQQQYYSLSALAERDKHDPLNPEPSNHQPSKDFPDSRELVGLLCLKFQEQPCHSTQ